MSILAGTPAAAVVAIVAVAAAMAAAVAIVAATGAIATAAVAVAATVAVVTATVAVAATVAVVTATVAVAATVAVVTATVAVVAATLVARATVGVALAGGWNDARACTAAAVASRTPPAVVVDRTLTLALDERAAAVLVLKDEARSRPVRARVNHRPSAVRAIGVVETPAIANPAQPPPPTVIG